MIGSLDFCQDDRFEFSKYLLHTTFRLLSLRVCTVVTMIVIGLVERNAQADNGRAEMVCNDKWRTNKIKQKLQKPQKNKRDTGTNAKRNVKNTKANYRKGK